MVMHILTLLEIPSETVKLPVPTALRTPANSLTYNGINNISTWAKINKNSRGAKKYLSRALILVSLACSISAWETKYEALI